MKVIADKSFQKDILKLDAAAKNQISKLIIQLNQTTSINEIPNFKKIKGFKNAYRIRLGNYRIGIRMDGETVLLIRILHRKDIYHYFPIFI
jgi:mRNA interferase RelE/StbE